MENNENKEKEETKTILLDADRLKIIIPACCREGWPDCPHVPKKQRKSKTNVGL